MGMKDWVAAWLVTLSAKKLWIWCIDLMEMEDSGGRLASDILCKITSRYGVFISSETSGTFPAAFFECW